MRKTKEKCEKEARELRQGNEELKIEVNKRNWREQISQSSGRFDRTTSQSIIKISSG